MQINWKGQEHRVALNLRRGIRPRLIDDDFDEEGVINYVDELASETDQTGWGPPAETRDEGWENHG